MKTKQIHLTFSEGTSNKEYNAWIEEVSKGKFAVNFSFGRIGKALKDGTKTPELVSLSEAEVIYQELVDSKLKKGYRESD